MRFSKNDYPVFTSDTESERKPHDGQIRSRFTLPGVARTLINSPSLSISLDGNKLLAEVDGRIFEDEQ